MKWFSHFKTITRHRWIVMKHCFRLGLYRQGLTHDLSKYAPIEFLAGAKYYQGDKSPNDAQRRAEGVSTAWLHHKGRNRHHYEYWIDYSLNGDHTLTGMKMPVRYVAEMFCDRIAANKVYKGKAYTDKDAYDYYARSKDTLPMHPETKALLEKMLIMLRDEGEEKTFSYIKKEILKK